MHKYIRNKDGLLEVKTKEQQSLDKLEDTKSYDITFGLSNNGIVREKFTGTPSQLQEHLTQIEDERVLIKQQVVNGKKHIAMIPYHAITLVEIEEL